MAENPYDSPAPIVEQAAVEGPRDKAPRPIGVSILAVLHFFGGLLLFGAQFLLFANLQAMEEPLRAIGIPPVLLIIGVMFLAILTIASAVGMWLGTKWGWWLASFYYMYSVFRNGSALVTLIAMAEQLEGVGRGPEYYMIKHGGRVIINLLLFLYFFKGNVLEFFRLESLNKAIAVAILVGICIALAVAASTVGLLAS